VNKKRKTRFYICGVSKGNRNG